MYDVSVENKNKFKKTFFLNLFLFSTDTSYSFLKELIPTPTEKRGKS